MVGVGPFSSSDLGLGTGVPRWDWQHPPLLPQQACVCELEAEDCCCDLANDLQKRVLFGSERHWRQVPGPLMQGLVVDDERGRDGRGRDTSVSDGGGVMCESCDTRGMERVWFCSGSNLW